MWPCAYALAPHSGRARSNRQSTIAHSGWPRTAASSVGSISGEVGISDLAGLFIGRAFWAWRACRYNRCQESELWRTARENDGDRCVLGEWQSVRLARPAGVGVQATALYQSPVAVLQAGAQVAADARAQLAWQGTGAEGWRLRLFRVAGDSVLPGSQI